MSFSIFELSRFKARPLNLYLFKTGAEAGEYLAFTDGERPITVGGIVYSPAPMKRGRITSSGSLDKSQLEITTTKSSPLFEIYRVYPPSFVITVVVKQGHYGDPDNQFLSIWSGRIADFEAQGNEVTFQCEPAGTSIRTPGLRRNFQRGCMHALYGPQCRATPHPIDTEVIGLVPGFITLDSGWNGSVPSPKFTGGTVGWTPTGGPRYLRTILSVSDDGLTLRVAGTTQALEVGDTVTVLVGCNHQMTDCMDLHDNILNYGGDDWIPTDNPVGNSNQFY